MIDHHWDAVGADYVLTETGGWSTVGHDGVRHVTVNVAEKGIAWRRLRVHGTPGHGSMPYGSDNALVTAAEIVRRLVAFRPQPNLDDLWQARIATLDLPDDLRAALVDPARIDDALASLPPDYARVAHACTHTTMSPNVVHGGQKTNTIPDVIDIDVDIRTVPGRHQGGRRRLPRRGARRARRPGRDLADPGVRVDPLGRSATRCGTRCARTPRSPTPAPTSCPGIITGGTDARFYRAKGAIAYGAALFSPDVTMESFGTALPRQRRADRRRRRSACPPSSGTASPRSSSAEAQPRAVIRACRTHRRSHRSGVTASRRNGRRSYRAP